MDQRATYFNQSGEYTLQRPTVGGTTQGTENDLSALFLERVFELASTEGYVSQILPGAVFSGSSGKDLRLTLLNDNEINTLITFENRGIFDDLHYQYNFGIVTFKSDGRTDTLKGIFQQRDLNVLHSLQQIALDIPRQVLEKYSPEARIFPHIESQEEVAVLNSILQHPPISEPDNQRWYAEPYRELDRTQDADRFIESAHDGDYPVLGGSNVYQFSYDHSHTADLEEVKFWSVSEDTDEVKSAKQRIRGKNIRTLKRQLYNAFDGSGSQKSFVNNLLEQHRGEPLSEDDVLLDSTEYRIVYRDIARASDERTMIATVIPPGWVCHNTLHTIRPYKVNPAKGDLSQTPLHGVYQRVFSDRELFAALGLLNSIPFDFLMRTKTDTHIVMYKFEESQVPRLTEGDDWFEYISMRAAKLNCYGDEFQKMRDRLGDIQPTTKAAERRELRAEIDAAAFLAYGLNQEEVKFVLEDFHRVSDPRLMTEEYFSKVLETFKRLSEAQPHP